MTPFTLLPERMPVQPSIIRFRFPDLWPFENRNWDSVSVFKHLIHCTIYKTSLSIVQIFPAFFLPGRFAADIHAIQMGYISRTESSLRH